MATGKRSFPGGRTDFRSHSPAARQYAPWSRKNYVQEDRRV